MKVEQVNAGEARKGVCGGQMLFPGGLSGDDRVFAVEFGIPWSA
jgi:hypothetical protein